MNTLKLREITLEPGRPKIAVSIMSSDPKDMIAECERIKETPCDMIEWRADSYLGAIDDPETVVGQKDFYLDMMKILDDINYIADGKPVIFTVRSVSQGGGSRLAAEHLTAVRDLVAQSGLADLIDVELFDENGNIDEEAVRKQIEDIHRYGCRVILSHHDIDGMPAPEKIIDTVETMNGMGADVSKFAAMAGSKKDNETLLKASAYLNRKGIGPLIMIAMGEEGRPARVAAGRYGSCVTFACVDEPSAPGQVDVYTMKKWLDDYYGEKEQ